MRFRDYQAKATETDQHPEKDGLGLLIPLLGLPGEVGSLLGEYKKHLRDGKSHRLFKEGIAEELGDILWYMSNLATKFGINLEEIAQENLSKTRDRWARRATQQALPGIHALSFDSEYEEQERLPRSFRMKFQESGDRSNPRITITQKGVQVGDRLTDNAYYNDGYRFHDVFHLAHAAILGWSPVVRSLLDRKRRSNRQVDEIEDGGRAIVIEEGITAYVYEYAKRHALLKGITILDYDLLKTIKRMTSGLEVSRRSMADWEKAILDGYRVFRAMLQNRGGFVSVDLDTQKISYSKN